MNCESNRGLMGKFTGQQVLVNLCCFILTQPLTFKYYFHLREILNLELSWKTISIAHTELNGCCGHFQLRFAKPQSPSEL